MHQERFDQIRADFLREIAAAGTESEVLDIKGRYTGKKRGVLQELMTSLKEVAPEERPAFGQAVNALKNELERGRRGPGAGPRRQAGSRGAGCDPPRPAARPRATCTR